MDCPGVCAESGRGEYHIDLENHLRGLMKAEIQTGKYPLLRLTKPRSKTRPEAIRTSIMVRRPFIEGRGRNLEVGRREIIYSLHGCLLQDWQEGIRDPCESISGKTLLRPIWGTDLEVRSKYADLDLLEYFVTYLPNIQQAMRRGAYTTSVQELLLITESAAKRLFRESYSA